MEDYDRLEAMEEQISHNTMWELNRLKKKSLTDDEEKLRLSRALICKRQLMDLEENCTAELYIEAAHRCTEAMGELSQVISPESTRSMLASTFTPKSLNTNFTIPRSNPANLSKKAAADEWGPRNFPPSLRKAAYNIS